MLAEMQVAVNTTMKLRLNTVKGHIQLYMMLSFDVEVGDGGHMCAAQT